MDVPGKFGKIVLVFVLLVVYLTVHRIYTSPIYYRIEHSALITYLIRWCLVLSSMFGSVETGEFYYYYTSRFIAVLNIL